MKVNMWWILFWDPASCYLKVQSPEDGWYDLVSSMCWSCRDSFGRVPKNGACCSVVGRYLRCMSRATSIWSPALCTSSTQIISAYAPLVTTALHSQTPLALLNGFITFSGFRSGSFLFWYNLDTTAKQDAIEWSCVAKRRRWLGEEMYGIWGGGLQTKS